MNNAEIISGIPAVKPRMEWLDAMRGFTMILVVAYHVAQITFMQDEKISASLPFLVLFRMPLFFFVSGFLAYKSKWVWTVTSFFSLIWKKIKIQVLPAFVFLCVLIILKRNTPFFETLLSALRLPTKSGYWFTWVLLQMFVIYYVVAVLAQKLKSHIPVWILWLFCLFAYLSLYLPKEFGKWYKTDFMMYSSFYETLKFMHFFVVGNLVHRYWPLVLKLFQSKWLYPLLTIVAFFSCADIFKLHLFKLEWTNLPRTLAMYSLMFMVVMFFHYYQDSFTKSTRIGRGLQYIGVRTLDIYLLHFILLPRLPMVGAFLNNHHPNFLLDVVLAVTLALIVIAGCCLVSNILRVSPIFKEYLFGRK